MPATPRVLLTGFEPFDGERVNPSWTAARLATREPLPGVEVEIAELPCVFGAALDAIWAHIERFDPDVVIAVGQAGGRAEISVERIGINLDHARLPDNAGVAPDRVPIVADGPAAYFATIPVDACVEAVRAAGVPASASLSAGTFVCNHVLYGALHRVATQRPARVRVGFVHVPYAPEQLTGPDGPAPGTPSMPPRMVAVALRALIAAAVR